MQLRRNCGGNITAMGSTTPIEGTDDTFYVGGYKFEMSKDAYDKNF